jgi:hypothetical protein
MLLAAKPTKPQSAKQFPIFLTFHFALSSPVLMPAPRSFLSQFQQNITFDILLIVYHYVSQ